ncbi:MAG TPA: GGDEF domain-containing protein, partial [Mycobacterium sp.]|uniref:GGDEF domain-containing protein n=1 Tax=Mycobacterium sp. TaxID=1785 RepID=UPI002D35A00B
TAAGRYVVAFAVPIRRFGLITAVLLTFADVRSWPLQGYDAALHIGLGSTSLVVDRTGRVTAASQPRLLGQRPRGIPAAAMSGGTGMTSNRVNGADALISYGPAGHGWTALTMQPVAAFSGAIDHSRDVAVLALAALLSAAVICLVVFHHKRQRVFARLAEQRLYDPLTGLGQRALLQARLDAALARRRRHGRPLALLYCDLDGFKGINDRYGHNAGDNLLVATARRIVSVLRDTDMAVRLGGDEFAVVLEETSPSEAAAIARRIRDAVATPLTVNGICVTPQLSIGGGIIVDGDAQADDLLHEADLAMYESKRGDGQPRVVVTHGAHSSCPIRIAKQRPAGDGTNACQAAAH